MGFEINNNYWNSKINFHLIAVTPQSKRSILLSCIFSPCTYLCGVLVITSYVTAILTETGFSYVKSFSLFVPLVQLMTNLIFSYVIERFDRKVRKMIWRTDFALNFLSLTDVIHLVIDTDCYHLFFIRNVLDVLVESSLFQLDVTTLYFVDHFYRMSWLNSNPIHRFTGNLPEKGFGRNQIKIQY